jgi:hypothetical protein
MCSLSQQQQQASYDWDSTRPGDCREAAMALLSTLPAEGRAGRMDKLQAATYGVVP